MGRCGANTDLVRSAVEICAEMNEVCIIRTCMQLSSNMISVLSLQVNCCSPHSRSCCGFDSPARQGIFLPETAFSADSEQRFPA